MKIKKILPIAIIMFIILTAKTSCSAKYVFVYVEQAFLINIVVEN